MLLAIATHESYNNINSTYYIFHSIDAMTRGMEGHDLQQSHLIAILFYVFDVLYIMAVKKKINHSLNLKKMLIVTIL